VTASAWFRWTRRTVLAIIAVIVLLVLYVAVHVWWVAREDQHPRSDAIVVLGASQYNGTPSAVFAARLAHAVTLYNERVAAHIVTVGGKQPGDAYTEAASGKTYLTSHGVPPTAIIAVETGSDTLSSLRAVDVRFKARRWHSAVLVTDPWHCLRSRTMARDLGLSAYTSPERTGPAVHGRGTELRYISRETAAYIYYKIFHNDHEHSAGAV
jgi:uncharacterized SAM-binding protein YcdF (DUF218 family)